MGYHVGEIVVNPSVEKGCVIFHGVCLTRPLAATIVGITLRVMCTVTRSVTATMTRARRAHVTA
jgi:hypothetical protein